MAAQYGKGLTLKGGDLSLHVMCSVILTHLQGVGLICSSTSLVRSLTQVMKTTQNLSLYYSNVTCPYKKLHLFDARQR